MRAYVQENPGTAGFNGSLQVVWQQKKRSQDSQGTTTLVTKHPIVTPGIVLAAGLSWDYMRNESAATRAIGRGAQTAGSHVRDFVVDSIMHPRAHYFKAAGLYTGLAAAGLTIDQLAANGKARKAVSAAAKKAGERIQSTAVATVKGIKDGASHPVENKGKAAIVYGTTATGCSCCRRVFRVPSSQTNRFIIRSPNNHSTRSLGKI